MKKTVLLIFGFMFVFSLGQAQIPPVLQPEDGSLEVVIDDAANLSTSYILGFGVSEYEVAKAYWNKKATKSTLITVSANDTKKALTLTLVLNQKLQWKAKDWNEFISKL